MPLVGLEFEVVGDLALLSHLQFPPSPPFAAQRPDLGAYSSPHP